MKWSKQLTKELHQAGANQAEVAKLLPVASRLRQLSAKKSPALKLIQPLTIGLAGLVIGLFLVVASQSVLPNSWLYPVQRLSDNLAIDMHPAYRATVMMKRAQQVNQLVARHASDQQVLATLASYVQQADAYKTMPGSNYAAFEFCKTNLHQAEQGASASVRQAINDSLRSLQNV